MKNISLDTESDGDVLDLSVQELFCSGQYTIPRYQRNYAWGEGEVQQLLQDVLDLVGGTNDRHYYLGSLVTYLRDDGVYETIDGQQRHTTLCIVLSVLKNVFSQDLRDITRLNLCFDTRPRSDRTLEGLFDGVQARKDEETSMRAAFEVAERFLLDHKARIGDFTRVLLDRVRILRVIVPEETDLNHYFEIMNNRGEQLEKHEVLKARMMSGLPDTESRRGFAVVWDACADMHRYVQMGFDSNIRTQVFREGLNRPEVNFAELCRLSASCANGTEPMTLASVLATRKLASGRGGTPEGDGTALMSIVDFPNFLLYVLSILTGCDIPLDDKRLLETFDQHKPCPQAFLVALLECRLLFDRFVIRRQRDERWSLKTLKQERGSQPSYVNSFGDDPSQAQLIMLLSMFHVSFPSQIYKHWLKATLAHLYQQRNEGHAVEAAKFVQWLETLGRKFLVLRGGAVVGDVSIPEIMLTAATDNDGSVAAVDPTVLHRGTAVPNFIFNWLDYLLWKRLRDRGHFEGVDMGYVGKRAERFSFTMRSSVEHFYPRNPIAGEELDNCDRFGNLCLISHSMNSRMSNLLPDAKKTYFEQSEAVESLKQTFMMSYKDWGPDDLQFIDEHERMMIELLNAPL